MLKNRPFSEPSFTDSGLYRSGRRSCPHCSEIPSQVIESKLTVPAALSGPCAEREEVILRPLDF